MSQKKSSKLPDQQKVSPQSVANAEWGGFIDVRMDEVATEEFQRWSRDNSNELWTMFQEALATGQKFSLSFDKTNDCFIATFTSVVASLSARRYALTARANSWEEATYLLLFKHYWMLKEDWGSFKPKLPFNNSWG